MHRRLEPLEHLLLAPAEQLGQHPVDHDGGQVDVGLRLDAARQLDRLVDRHLLRRGHDHHAGRGRVGQDVDHPARLLAHQADLHQLVDGLRRGQLADDVAGRRGVDHDQVVVALAHLPPQLADGEDLLHAGRGRGHELEDAGQRADPGHAAGSLSWRLRYSLSDSSVSIDMANSRGWTSRGLKVVGPVS